MAITQNEYVGNGVDTLFPFTFEYLNEAHVKVSLDGVDTTEYTLANSTTVEFDEAPSSGVEIRIYRQTADDQLVATFYPGSTIRAQDLNDDFEQVLYIAQETRTYIDNTDLSDIADLAKEAKETADEAIVIANEALDQVQKTQGLIIQDNEPSIGVEGTLWVNTSEDPPLIYVYDGTEWVISSGGGASVHVGDNPPEDEPTQGDLWWNSADGRMYVFYVDADSSQWVDASPDAGALTPGVLPPDNPNNGDIWVDLSQCPPVLNIWSDCTGTGEWVPGGAALTAPEINNVTLGNGQGGAGRFTGATFQVAATMTEEGSPESDRRLRIQITEDAIFRNPGLRALTRPVTREITNVENIDFADGITMINSSENAWKYIRWCGEPFNRYIAVADSGSNTFKTMWSFDGEEWFQFTMKGLGLGSQPNFFYRPTNQRIYVSNAGRDTQFNTISTVEQLLNNENNGENWTANRPHDNSSSRNYMDYDPDTDRVYILRPQWDVCNTWSMEPGWTSMNNSDWNSKGGTGGSNMGGGICHNGRYMGFATDHDGGTRGAGWVLVGGGSKVTLQSTRDKNGYTSYPAYHPGLDRYFINGWYCDGPPENAGTSMSNWTSWTGGITSQGYARGISHLFYSSQLDLMVAVGNIRINDGDPNQYCHWTSPDGVTWSDYILTNPDTQEDGYWSFGLDAPQVASHLLCSAGGNVAGKRFGVTQTLGTTQSFPELTFASDQGLDAFHVGNQITQSDQNAEGVVARIADGRMVVNGTPAGQTWGPANTGLWVVGPEENFDPAWAEIDGDGNVVRLLPFNPGYELMNGTGPWNITFPAVFPNGTVPDEVIPAGSSIRADLAAVSNADGFIASDEAQSNVVTPS